MTKSRAETDVAEILQINVLKDRALTLMISDHTRTHNDKEQGRN
jgi:hypothetical protein